MRGIKHKLQLAVAAFAVTASFSCSSSGNREALIQKATALAAAGKHEEAALNFRKVLQSDPQNSKVAYALGLSYLRQNNLRDAYDALQRANQLAPADPAATTALAELCLLLYSADASHPELFYKKAHSLVDVLTSQDAASFDSLRLRGYLAILDKRPAIAVDFLKRAYRLKKADPELVIALMRTYDDLGRQGDAETLGRTMIESSAATPAVYDLIYIRYMRTQRIAEAERILAVQIEKNPEAVAPVLKLCRHAARKSKQDVKSCLARLTTYRADSVLEVARFWQSLGESGEAVAHLRAFQSKSTAGEIERKLLLGQLVLSTGGRDEASRIFDEVIAKYPDHPRAKVLRAQLRVESADPKEMERALKDLRKVAADQPSNADAQYWIGEALAAKGDRTRARTAYEAALQAQPGHLGALQRSAEYDANERKFESALSKATVLTSVDGRNVPAALVRSAALLGLARYAEARTLIERVLQVAPGNPEATLQLASIHIAQRQFSAAETRLSALVRPGTRDIRPLIGLANLYTATGRFEKARELLEEEFQRSKNVALASALIEAAAAAGQNSTASRWYENTATQVHSVTIHSRMADVYASSGDTVKAVQAARRALSLDSSNPYLKNNLASVLADSGGTLDEALHLAKQAYGALPNNRVVQDTLGWIHVRRDQPQEGLRYLERAVLRHQTSAGMQYHYAVALLKTGEYAKAVTAINAGLKASPAPVEATQLKDLLKRVPEQHSRR